MAESALNDSESTSPDSATISPDSGDAQSEPKHYVLEIQSATISANAEVEAPEEAKEVSDGEVSI